MPSMIKSSRSMRSARSQEAPGANPLGPQSGTTLTPLHCTRHRSPLRGGAQQDAFKVLYKSLDATDRFSILSDGTRIQLTVHGSDPHPGGWSPGPGTRPDASKHSLSWSSRLAERPVNQQEIAARRLSRALPLRRPFGRPPEGFAPTNFFSSCLPSYIESNVPPACPRHDCGQISDLSLPVRRRTIFWRLSGRPRSRGRRAPMLLREERPHRGFAPSQLFSSCTPTYIESKVPPACLTHPHCQSWELSLPVRTPRRTTFAGPPQGLFHRGPRTLNPPCTHAASNRGWTLGATGRVVSEGGCPPIRSRVAPPGEEGQTGHRTHRWPRKNSPVAPENERGPRNFERLRRARYFPLGVDVGCN